MKTETTTCDRDRALILSQLTEIRNQLNLEMPYAYVAWTGEAVAFSPNERDIRTHLYVTMNDTDQILADLAEVL